MYRSEHQAFLFFSKNYDTAITVVFMELYHWGTLDWNGHKAGDWFFKSIREMSAELGISTKPVRKAYDIIKNGECPFFESKIERRKNYPITYFRVISKDSHHVPQVHSKDSHHVPQVSKPCTSGTQYHVPQVHGINILTHNDCMYTESTISSEIPLTENPAKQTDNHLKMIEIWNELIQPSKPETMTALIEKKCHEALLSHFENNIEQWKNYCSRIASSSFLMGEQFTLTLGWALKAEWIQKVLNGDYDDHDWRKENDMARKPKPVKLEAVTLDEVLAACKNEIDRKIKPILFQKLGAETYASWIHRTSASFYVEGEQICVNSCSRFVRKEIINRFWDKIEKIYNNGYFDA